jgi:hypothetical protein
MRWRRDASAVFGVMPLQCSAFPHESSCRVGFGISPDGGMVGSDVVMMMVTADGTPVLSNRYTVAHSLPLVAATQTWFLISMSNANGVFTAHFW